MSIISANTNIPAMRSLLALGNATLGLNRSMERLATGLKINRASDDPAGMVEGEQLKTREKAINAKLSAMDREEYTLGAKEGAYSLLSDSFVELRGLVTQAANTSGLTKDEKQAIQDEIDGVLGGADFTIATATFDKQAVLGGTTLASFGKQTKTHVNDKGETVQESFSIADLRSGGRLNVIDGDLTLASLVVDGAVGDAASTRGAIGTRLKSMDSERGTLLAELEGITKEKSRVLDTDYASETATFVRQQVLQEAAMRVTQVAIQQQRQQVSSMLNTIA